MLHKRHVPNFLTLVNLSLGLASIAFSGFYNFQQASWCIFFAALFDLLDGMAARMLKAQSAVGKELDSMADLVSFGVAPGMLMFTLTWDKAYMFREWPGFQYELYVVVASCLLIPVFTAIRLARFNVDPVKRKHFRGLPSPANGMLIATVPFVLEFSFYEAKAESFLLNSYTVLAFNLILCYLLVSHLPMLSLKPKSLRFSEVRFHLALLVLSIPLVAIFRFASAPIIFVLYVIFSQMDALLNPDRSAALLEQMEVVSATRKTRPDDEPR